MSVDTVNEKFSLINLGMPWAPGLPPVSTDTIDQADQQQLLKGFPGVAWAEGLVSMLVQAFLFRAEFDWFLTSAALSGVEPIAPKTRAQFQSYVHLTDPDETIPLYRLDHKWFIDQADVPA